MQTTTYEQSGAGTVDGMKAAIIAAMGMFPPDGTEERGDGWFRTERRIDVSDDGLYIVAVCGGRKFEARCSDYAESPLASRQWCGLNGILNDVMIAGVRSLPSTCPTAKR